MRTKTRMRQLTAIVAMGVVALVGVGVGSAPASANPAYITRSTNTLSPQYEVNGCRYKVQYGNFGGTAYALLRIYNPSGCSGTSVGIVYNAGSGNQSVYTNLADGYTTGTDGCGSYRTFQAASPVTAFAIRGVALLPPDGEFFGGLRVYAAEGTGSQTPYSAC